MIIGSSLEDFAKSKPRERAVVCDDESLSWSELFETVQAIAADMDARQPQGRTIALILKNSPAMLAHFLACAASGREAAVIDPAWPQARITDVLSELAPALIYSDSGMVIPNAISGDGRARRFAGGPTSRRCEADSESSFYVGFTSGSTGRPKGYRRSHQSWLASFAGDRIEFGLTEDDVVLAPGSMTHSLFLYAAVHALHIGATLLMSHAFHPARALRMAREHRATIAYGAPTQWRMLLDACAEPLPQLRWVLSSGAKWFARASEDIPRLAPNARFAEFYGASELSFVAVRKSGEACPESSVGRAFSGVNISIRDDGGNLLGRDEPGRVFVESPYLFSGYATGDENIASHAGAMTVGDMGYLDAQGFLHLVGRRDRMIVTSGKNVFAEEIERALESIPGVRAAAALGEPDDLRGQKIVALVLAEESVALCRADLKRAARALLPLPFVPRLFAAPAQWRWTSSGKTDFKAMASLWAAGEWTEIT
jgi:long-chain acyl-CoA synthetase